MGVNMLVPFAAIKALTLLNSFPPDGSRNSLPFSHKSVSELGCRSSIPKVLDGVEVRALRRP